MPSKLTDKMRLALKLISRGASPTEAAQKSGVKRQSIYASTQYKALKEDMARKEALK